MRDILFRAKAKHNPTLWVYGDYLSTIRRDGEKKHYIKRAEDGLLTPVEIIPETLGQYTGFIDKNRTKIFEDDIVKVTDDNGSTTPCSCGIGCVCFYDGSWYIEDEVNDGLSDVKRIYYIEIIGNITDSPELLGGAE